MTGVFFFNKLKEGSLKHKSRGFLRKMNNYEKLMKATHNNKVLKRDEIADLQVYQLEGITYCLPINSTPELRQYFATAIKAYKYDADFDEILLFEDIKKYQDKEYIDKDLVTCYMIARGVDNMLDLINDFYCFLCRNDENFHIGEITYFNTMARLRESFKSTLILCYRGFYIEMMPIMRLIYEQLCWACYSIDESNSNNILNNWKTKNTRYIKEKINPKYGRLYSFLSSEAHMAPPEARKYLSFDKKNNCSVIGRSGSKAKKDIPIIIQLYQIYLEVFNYGIKHFSYDTAHYQELLKNQFEDLEIINAVHSGKATDFSFIDRV